MSVLETLLDINTKVSFSNTNTKILKILLSNNSKQGEVKKNGKFLGVNDIAKILDVKRNKVSVVVKRLIEENLVKKSKRVISY